MARKTIVVLGLLGSITMALWLPPFSGPDEWAHWYRAVHVSSGHVLSVRQGDVLGDRLPVWAEDLRQALPGDRLAPGQRVTAEAWKQAQEVPYSSSKRFVAFVATAMYPPTFYLPQAIAIKVGRLFHAQPITLFYSTRVVNACVAWLGISAALSCAGELALYWGALLLLPVVLQQLGTLSPDASMIVCALLLAAVVRKAATAPGPQPKLWLWATATIGLLAQARPPLVALVALLYMPALARHASRSLWRTRVVCSLVACAIAFPWFVGCLIYGASLRHDLPSVHDKAHMLLHDPATFAAMLWRTTVVHADGYYWMLVGSLGYLDAPISPGAYAASKVALACSLILGLGRNYALRALDTLCLWLAMVGSYCAMQGVFFLTWTALDSPVIQGFQGRYAMMFLPLLPLALPRVPLANSLRWMVQGVLLMAVLRMMAGIPWAVLQRYYL